MTFLTQQECNRAVDICRQINVRCEIILQDLAEAKVAIQQSIDATDAFIAKLEAAQRKVRP